MELILLVLPDQGDVYFYVNGSPKHDSPKNSLKTTDCGDGFEGAALPTSQFRLHGNKLRIPFTTRRAIPSINRRSASSALGAIHSIALAKSQINRKPAFTNRAASKM
jgi:hypothetical protein